VDEAGMQIAVSAAVEADLHRVIFVPAELMKPDIFKSIG
jgi:hypothetical protein